MHIEGPKVRVRVRCRFKVRVRLGFGFGFRFRRSINQCNLPVLVFFVKKGPAARTATCSRKIRRRLLRIVVSVVIKRGVAVVIGFGRIVVVVSL